MPKSYKLSGHQEIKFITSATDTFLYEFRPGYPDGHSKYLKISNLKSACGISELYI